jgi:mono/diheme cytochrome c family protein
MTDFGGQFSRFSILVLVTVASVTALAAPSPRNLYNAACARCHGEDGRGMPEEQVGFEEPLPDFTDCSFASREPDADWLAVAHDGGPVRAFAPMMPAFGEALSAKELNAILEHVRSFCRNAAWPRGELNLPRPLVTEKAFPEDEAVWSTAMSEGGVANKLIYEKRIRERSQFEIILPFGWEEGPEEGWRGGVGDVGLALKHALWHSLERGSIFSAAAEVKIPTGSESRGFGSGTTVFEPFLAWGQILPAEWFLHVQAGAEIPSDRDRDDEAFFRAAVGRTFTEGKFGRAWSPMVEVLTWRDLVSKAQTHWDVVPQVQVTLSRRQHLMASFGVRVPLDNRSSRDAEVMMYLLWDWFDGGLTDGW